MQDQPVSISENTLLQLRQENEKLVQINTDYTGEAAPPYRRKQRHLRWADLRFNDKQF